MKRRTLATFALWFFASTVFAATPQEQMYPVVAKDQSRPVKSLRARTGNVTSNLENDPCTIDPSWCGGGTGAGGSACGTLCTTKSCGTKTSDQRCRVDKTTGVALYYCANAIGVSCDLETNIKGLTTCATCSQ